MNPFSILIEDIFNNADFTDVCKINGKTIKCIVSSISNDSIVTQFGVDLGISFYLTIKKQDYINLKKNDVVEYKHKQYKVDMYTLDSAAQTYAVYLRSLSSKG